MASLFNGISTLFRLFNVKTILLQEQYWYYLTHSWEDKGVHTFPRGICPKVNVIARLEYELAYYDSAVHPFNHYTTRTPLLFWEFSHQIFITFIRFLRHSFLWSSFLALVRYSFFFLFSFISSCLMSASTVSKYLYVSFSPSVLAFFLVR